MKPTPPRTAIHRIACAVIAEEVRRLRDAPLPAPHLWPESMPVGEEGLGLDSLEQLGAMGALAEAFGLDDATLGHDPPRTIKAWIDWIMHRHAGGDGHVTVRTSGSTGSPVSCTHAMADLLGEADYLATRFAGRRRVVALVPAHHLYGVIWTALLPALLDTPVSSPPAGTSLNLAPGDLVVAVPDQWRTIGSLWRQFPQDVAGVSSAGPLQDQLAVDLLAAGLVTLVDVYGSSETGAIAIREVPDTGYELLPRWHLVHGDGDGDWQLGDAAGRRHDLPDHIERIGERRLRPAGRRDGAVQVGGRNVWPTRVAEVLRQVDGVADAAVRLHAGGRLKAFIVPDIGRDEAQLTALIERVSAERLSVAERPRTLRFGAALPRNAMGKLEDWP